MSNYTRDRSTNKLSGAFGVAKKLSQAGLDKLNARGRGQKTAQTGAERSKQVIDGQAEEKNAAFATPQSIVREYVPNLSRQLLGRHHGRLSQIVGFVSPVGLDGISDYLFTRLNQFSEQLSSVDKVLEQAGVKHLDHLKQDVSRSGRVSQALIEQNKYLAAAQGGICGAAGAVGSGLDIPLSIVLVLKTVYQTGRAYGFELKAEDQDIVAFIFKQIQLDSIMEKQTLLIAIRTVSNAIKSSDIAELQRLIGSENDLTWIKNFIHERFDDVDLNVLSKVPKLSVITKLTPVVTLSIGTVYSWKLIEDAGQNAQHVFSVARDYLIQHPEQDLSALAAYQQAVNQLQQ